MRRVVALALVWGWSFLFIKVAGRGMTPATVAGTRIALGAIVLTVALRVAGGPLPRDRTAWRHFFVMGLTYSAVPFTLLAWGEQHISSSVAAVGNATTPLFTALGASLALAERLHRPQIVGLVLGFVGVAVAAGLAGRDVTHSSSLGVLASVAAAACYGVAFIYARRNLGDVPPLVAAAGQLVAASIVMVPIAVTTTLVSGIHLTLTRAASIILLGVFGTGFAYAVNYRNIKLLGPTRASLVTYFVPVVAITVGVVLLGEAFSARLIVGTVITVGGVALVQGRVRSLGRLRTVPLVGAVLAALLLTACSSTTSGAASACTRPTQHPLDPASAIHLLPGAPEPAYQTDPPTSGAHRLTGLASIPRGLLTQPISKSLQVAALEKGTVIIQFDRTKPAALSEALAALAVGQPLVALAPSASPTSAVAVTAWTWSMTCTTADAAAVGQFIHDHQGHGPGTA